MSPSVRIVALTLNVAFVTTAAMAQDEDLLLQETIIVEGDRSNPMFAGIEPEVSLDFVEIRSYGAASIEELLADLEPLTNSPGGGPPAILLNGRRISGLREIRNYPPEALARVEILPEAVALKFGFRANQKVTNFILRDRFHAISTRARLGGPTEGDQALGEIDVSNLRIRDDRRWNVDFEYEFQEALFESDRDIERDEGDGAADRTIQPEQHNVELSASLNDFLPHDISATYTLGLDATSQERAIAQSDLSDTIDRDTEDLNLEASFVLNRTYDDWNWTLNGTYARQDTESETEQDLVSGFTEATDATSNNTTIEGVVFRKLFQLPAGDVVTTLKAGTVFQDLSTTSEQDGSVIDTDLSRDEWNAQANVDVPLLSRDMSGNSIGSLSLNANARIDDVSDVGSLSTLGGGLSWKPTNDVQIIASTSTRETAPSLQTLGNPISVTETARIFDFSTGETIENITRITGGNPDLSSERITEHRLNLSWDLFDDPDLKFNLTYLDSDSEDAVLEFPGLTPEIERAFPERVQRAADGTLLSVDARPINIAERKQRQIRYGFNWSRS
ncbi:MAG: TonB-dependent receptor, partial [Pseudomonadota bacterium]